MATFDSILDQANDARTRIREVAAHEAGLPGEGGRIFLDVRESGEFNAGHIPGAVHLRRAELESRITEVVPDKATPIVAYCTVGHRSAIAADTLQNLGYQNVVSLEGGLKEYPVWENLRQVA